MIAVAGRWRRSCPFAVAVWFVALSGRFLSWGVFSLRLGRALLIVGTFLAGTRVALILLAVSGFTLGLAVASWFLCSAFGPICQAVGHRLPISVRRADRHWAIDRRCRLRLHRRHFFAASAFDQALSQTMIGRPRNDLAWIRPAPTCPWPRFPAPACQWLACPASAFPALVGRPWSDRGRPNRNGRRRPTDSSLRLCRFDSSTCRQVCDFRRSVICRRKRAFPWPSAVHQPAFRSRRHSRCRPGGHWPAFCHPHDHPDRSFRRHAEAAFHRRLAISARIGAVAVVWFFVARRLAGFLFVSALLARVHFVTVAGLTVLFADRLLACRLFACRLFPADSFGCARFVAAVLFCRRPCSSVCSVGVPCSGGVLLRRVVVCRVPLAESACCCSFWRSMISSNASPSCEPSWATG